MKIAELHILSLAIQAESIKIEVEGMKAHNKIAGRNPFTPDDFYAKSVELMKLSAMITDIALSGAFKS